MTLADPVALDRHGAPGLPIATLPDVIRYWAERTPEEPAILAPGRSPLSYGALLAQIEQTVRALNSAGIGRGDRVALVLPDGPELAVALLAVAATATAAPLAPDAPPDDLAARLTGLRPAAIVVPAGSASPGRAAAPPLLELCPVTGAGAGAFMLQGSTGRRPESPGFAQPEDVALLLHTSSTTGSPKRVPRNHRSVCAAARFAAAHFALGPADRCLNVASMVHSQGVNSIIIALVAGGSVVCTRGYDPARFAAWSEECRPTWTATVPTVLRTLLDQIREEPGRLGGRLRFVRSSAAPAPTALLAEAEAAFGVPVVSSYGMTEAPQIASPPLPPDPRKPGSVGPALGADIRIQGDAGEVLPPGEAGEVVVRGRTVFDGYDGDPEATAAAFTVDGWFRTGDLGYLDEDGYLFITGRLGDIINRGGVKISPLEVEQVLLAHEGIEQAVAFPVPDERLGEAVAAAVVARGGHPVDERALRRFAADRLAPTKVPRNVVFVEALPTKTNGKVRRRGLAALLGIEAASSANMPGAARTGLVRRGPEGPIEVLVADAWRTVLGLEDVDAEEEFLVLGGDSIQAARIVARLRVCLGLDLSLATFFEAPTVAAMATVIDDLLPQHMVGPGVGSKVPAEELAVRSRGVGDEVSGGE